MNKKVFIHPILMIIIGVGFIGLIANGGRLREEACKSLGFESYEYRQPWEFCADKQGNLHYVEVELTNWYYPTEYEIKEINVGDVRVVGG